MRLSSALRTARMELVRAAIDASLPDAGRVVLYAGTQPAAGETPLAPAQATILFGVPCGTVALGELVFGTPRVGVRINAQPTTWARITNGAGAWIADLTISTPGGGGDLVLDEVNGYPGGLVTLTSAVLQEAP